VFVYDFEYKDVHDHDEHEHDRGMTKGCENIECSRQGCVNSTAVRSAAVTVN
jgi:hypothetical protein